MDSRIIIITFIIWFVHFDAKRHAAFRLLSPAALAAASKATRRRKEGKDDDDFDDDEALSLRTHDFGDVASSSKSFGYYYSKKSPTR